MSDRYTIQQEFEEIVRLSQDFIRKYLDSQTSIVISTTEVNIFQSVKIE